ncbi:hypothetical protein C900_05483 [Fulvivirga imtechensis AK7]|uniref:Sirohydrochlorin cobaltochelatase n=1 Tax=Fulvivirga imtechensis AK7 TaxID=1237149 RepID=L8JNI5_9BACT|nr:CbiX/SirB N-terminal domain-containing protein [Fulvivirga imtechensis]ELR69094.1 hypothetical protein C900_05483 [Fulvivirga imtechensis AK7]
MKTLIRTFIVAMWLIFSTVAVALTHSTPKVGILILAHGGSNSWNEHVEAAVAPIRSDFPVEIAYGMALPRTIQQGINNLENNGVDKIIVVPLFISSHSFIIRQTEYLLGKRNELADPPIVMDHSGGHGGHGTSGHHGSQHGASDQHHSAGSGHKPELLPLQFKSEIIMTTPLDNHPLVASMLYDRIQELSERPAQETVVIVGHGPNPEDDNRKWVKAMESLADQIREKQKTAGTQSKFIFTTTVRDDADEAIYEQARENLRNMVHQAGKQGDVIVVPLLLSKGGVEKGIVKRLEGLTYKWSGKTLLPDSKITEFIRVSIDQALHSKL